jgi:hypothetical protein
MKMYQVNEFISLEGDVWASYSSLFAPQEIYQETFHTQWQQRKEHRDRLIILFSLCTTLDHEIQEVTHKG